MAGKIDCYLDSVSPFSYLAAVHLLRNRDALASQGVDVEFHPVFLGGIMQASNNKPPWTLPARAKYYSHDRPRAERYFDTQLTAPDNFPITTINAQRCLCYIKAHYPRERFEKAMIEFSKSVWENNEDTGKPEILRKVLGKTFDAPEADTIAAAAGQQKWKAKLTETTKEALDKGAYGAPWFWVRSLNGEEGPFFGSDRFAFMWKFLGLKWRDVVLENLGASKL